MFKASLAGIVLLFWGSQASAEATREPTPYDPQKVVFDFYFNDPVHIGPALYWIRSLMGPLMDEPYGYAPEELDIKVVVHGAEIVTLANNNYEQYREVVERMRYYHSLGIEFRVCGQAADDYGYRVEDFDDIVQVVPNAITELAHWQMRGYALIAPKIMEKRYAIEEIR